MSQTNPDITDQNEGRQESVQESLDRLREFACASLLWSADQLDRISNASPRVNLDELSVQLRHSASSIDDPSFPVRSRDALIQLLHISLEAIATIRHNLDRRDLGLGKILSSGFSTETLFGETIANPCTVSFRLKNRDVDAQAIAEAFQSSRAERAMLCVPGIFSDEGVWQEDRGQTSIEERLRKSGIFPIYVRMNARASIVDNGLELLRQLEELWNYRPVRNARISALTHSHGGLVLRSAFDQSRERRYTSLHKRLRHAVLVSSPDAGLHLPRMALWLGAMLRYAPMLSLRSLEIAANRENNDDLVHGRIRLSEKKRGRIAETYYHGELDQVEATQIYSVISNGDDLWRSWMGDGVAEEPSLTVLSGVYRKKRDGHDRVHRIAGSSHYQILQNQRVGRVLDRLFASVC